jgi:hypothetical protein
MLDHPLITGENAAADLVADLLLKYGGEPAEAHQFGITSPQSGSSLASRGHARFRLLIGARLKPGDGRSHIFGDNLAELRRCCKLDRRKRGGLQ